MIQPGGAMALFVLRLAGLLSLERSLGNNSSALNETFIQSFFNLKNNSENIFSGSRSTDFADEEDFNKVTMENEVVNPKFNFLKSHLDGEGSLILNNYTEEFINDTINFNEESSSNLTLISEINESNKSRQGFDIVEVLNASTFSRSSQNLSQHYIKSSHTLPPRNSDTGFSPVFTQSINHSSIPFYVNPLSTTKFNNFSLPYNNATKGNSSKLQEFESPDTVFLTKDFKYYNLEGFSFLNSSDYDTLNLTSDYFIPNLTSRSLVSPVPQPGQEKSFLEYLEKEAEKDNINQQNVVDQQITSEVDENDEKQTTSTPKDLTGATTKLKLVNKEISKKRGIGPLHKKENSHKRVPIRNNPYPYGPKVLPTQVRTLKPELKTKYTSETFESLFPGKYIFYDYEGENPDNISKKYDLRKTMQEKEKMEEKELEEDKNENVNVVVEDSNGKYFVKTEKPTILFHFDKPGYSPKLPDSSLPPTRAPTPSDPWDCAPRCPRYTLLDWNQDYDIRQYPVITWISTVIIATNRILAELEGYMRVQDYFYGLNDRGQLMNVTIPFVTQIRHGRHPGVLSEQIDYTVSLYVNHIDDPMNYDLPTPISNEVLIDKLESKTVFVAGFEANVWEVTEVFLDQKASALMEKLRQHGEAFLDRYYYLASYSRPELYQPVYYELWIYATSFRDNGIPFSPITPRARPPPNKSTTKSINKLCRGVECPPFEVLRTYRYGIQKRKYFDGLFATTSPGECEFTTISVWRGFMPLHLYKHGINSHMEVIEATRPIGLVHVKEDSTPTTECPQNLTMAIYLPKRLHSNPPLTGYDAPPVAINALQDVVVYAYTVGGYLLEPARVRKELVDLKHRLKEFGACFKNDEYYVVVYDFIARYHGRQNEIWVVAENCRATLNG